MPQAGEYRACGISHCAMTLSLHEEHHIRLPHQLVDRGEFAKQFGFGDGFHKSPIIPRWRPASAASQMNALFGTSHSQRVHVGKKVIHLLLGKHLAETGHFAASVSDDVGRPFVVRR